MPVPYQRLGGIEQLVGRIRELRDVQQELVPFTVEWYASLSVEARLLDELKGRLGVVDVEAVEWIVARA